MIDRSVTRLPGRHRRRLRAWKRPLLTAVAALATAAWVAWLVALPDADARSRAVVSPTSSVAAGPAPAVSVPSGPAPSVVTVPPSPSPSLSPSGAGRERPRRETTVTADVVVALASVLALSESEAVAWAEANGYLWRVTWRDGEAFAYSFDHVPERLNLEIAGGVVVYAWFG